MKTKSILLFCTVLTVFTLAGCTINDSASPGGRIPLSDPSEGVVKADDGAVAAELIATPVEITEEGRVQVRVVNRGTRAVSFGRPVTVEKWNGEAWLETEESCNSMWTMDLLYVESGDTGVEQPWPFLPDQRPDAGWYRMTKQVSAEAPGPDQDHVSLTIRTRVEVRE